ncbi:MAG: TolC family protein [Lutibacter sp.]|nr:TolC family protein [Lutibacter sp.]
MKATIVALLSLFLCGTITAQETTWSLQDCIEHALQHNLSIKQQELNTALSEEDVVTAKGNFYPSLNASASHNYNFGSYIDTYGGRVSTDSRTNNFSLGSGVTLFNGFRNKYLLEQAKKNLEMAGYDLEEQKNTLMLSIVNAYLNVLLGKESLSIAKEQVLIGKSLVEKERTLVASGVKAQASLLQAEASLAENRQQEVATQNNVDLALLSLAQILQVSHKGFDIKEVVLNIDAASLIYNDTDLIYKSALGLLPEIKRADLLVENADISLKIAQARNSPTFSLGGSVGSAYQHNQGQEDVRIIIDPETNTPVTVPNGFGKQLRDNMGYNIGLSLNIPIFNGFTNRSAIEKAKINQEKAALNVLEREKQVRETVERAYADAKAALNQYIAAEKSLASQRASFNNAQQSFELGSMTSFDFEQVRNGLVNAQASMANAKYNFVFRSTLLEFYLGIPLDIEP